MSVTPVPIRPGIQGDEAIRVLEHVAMEAGNAANNLPHAPIEPYLAWAESAYRQLRNVLDAEAASSYVHTPHYWSLRSGSLARPLPVIADELQEAKGTLEAATASLKAQRLRWSGGARLVVLDTNILLSERPVEGRDWPTALRSQEDVRLIVPIVVVHELDRLKRQGNNTARLGARSALKWLADVLPPDPSSRSSKFEAQAPATTVEVYVHAGPSRPPDADSTIISVTAGLASWRAATLVTFDLGMRLRATARGVNAVQLPEADE